MKTYGICISCQCRLAEPRPNGSRYTKCSDCRKKEKAYRNRHETSTGDEMTFPEIAAELGITENEVRKLYTSGMKKIKIYVFSRPELAGNWREILNQMNARYRPVTPTYGRTSGGIRGLVRYKYLQPTGGDDEILGKF